MGNDPPGDLSLLLGAPLHAPTAKVVAATAKRIRVIHVRYLKFACSVNPVATLPFPSQTCLHNQYVLL